LKGQAQRFILNTPPLKLVNLCEYIAFLCIVNSSTGIARKCTYFDSFSR